MAFYYINSKYVYPLMLITILQRKETVYSVVLGAVSIQDDKNSYYKLQVLQHDKKPKVDCLQILENIAFLI